MSELCVFAKTIYSMVSMEYGKKRLLVSLVVLYAITRPYYYSMADKLVQGQQLKANGQILLSDSGTFALGFFQTDTYHFYLGISYHDRFVWIANRNNPIPNDGSGVLYIDNLGNLKISYSGGGSIALYSVEKPSNTSAILMDNGNLILHEINSTDGSVERELWQSFDYPTDNLLPGMKLGVNRITGTNWTLTSWRSNSIPALGSFTLGLDPQDTKQLVLSWRGEIYWRSGPFFNGSFRNLNSSSLCLDCKFSYVSNENQTYFSYSYLDLELELPELEIGPNGDINVNGVVSCAEGWSNLDSGCVKKMLPIPECRKNQGPTDDLFSFEIGFMSSEGFKFDEKDNLTPYDCYDKCLRNCSCIAFASTNDINATGCEIWSRGAHLRRIHDESKGRIIHILSEELTVVSRNGIKNAENRWWIWLIGFTGALVLPLVYFILCVTARKLKRKVESWRVQKMLIREIRGNLSDSAVHRNQRGDGRKGATGQELHMFSFESIASATDNFSVKNKLGQGGFGPVYKGKFCDGQEIAIKRLSTTSGQGLLEFKNEVKVIAKLQYNNLVRLLGFCIQREERILIYEYMPNRSLDFYIFDPSRKNILNWKRRLSIIEGLAQGLVYLHHYSRLRVIHRDLKPSNVLLDDQMIPKISDFGMARIFELKGSEENTRRVVGTHGYMSPEYAMNGIVSLKTDVYSFGVLLLEILSGKKNHSSYHSDIPLNLIGYSWQLWSEGRGAEIVDSTLLEDCSIDEVLRCIQVGLLCVQDRAVDRPTMLDVVSMLSSENKNLPGPKSPAFYLDVQTDEIYEPISEPKIYSINEVTVPDMDAR